MRILIVEDDETLAEALTLGLGLSGFTADAVATAADAEAALAGDDGTGFAAMVLDLMLPDGSGLELLARVRARGVDLPVLLLTALDRVDDRVRGLDAGADDYLGKPFELDEVAARLRALLRRHAGRTAPHLAWRGLTLDPARLSGMIGDRPFTVSPREFAILAALLDRPGAILGRRTLEERLYGWQEGVESNAVEVHIHNLRAKLGPGVIETVRGAGYRLTGP